MTQRAKIYGMVKNIDDNMGKLHAKLDELELTNDTILIFLTDNGPQQERFNTPVCGARKGSVYQGGIRVPFFLRWPGVVDAGEKVDRIAAHIDVMPTVLQACGARPPSDRTIDGRSLMPLLKGDDSSWEDRYLFTQWHRGDAPEPFRACAVRNQKWKLINGEELYDMETDPRRREQRRGGPTGTLSPRCGRSTKTGSRMFPPGVMSRRASFIGTEHENPVVLTRQDWRGPKATWRPDGLGYWEVDVRDRGLLRNHVALRRGGSRWRGKFQAQQR